MGVDVFDILCHMLRVLQKTSKLQHQCLAYMMNSSKRIETTDYWKQFASSICMGSPSIATSSQMNGE